MTDKYKELWNKVLSRLEDKIKKSELTQLKVCVLEEDNGKFYITASNKFAKDTAKELQELVLSALKEENFAANIKIRMQAIESPKQAEIDFENNKDSAKKIEEDGKKYDYKLNEDYVFDTFIIGQSNQEAFYAVQAVIGVNDATGKKMFEQGFNPLLIYGGIGLGKSHLMHAAGHALIANGHKKVVYVTAEDFTNDYINAIKNASIQEFNNTYRNADALLIDDVQFLGRTDKSQEVFFHIFNTLHTKKVPIIFTSDRFPEEIEGLQDRLKSRFGWGLKVSVNTPEFETRAAIIQDKAERLDFEISKETVQFIAKHITSNVRDLEGALKQIYIASKFRNKAATPQLAAEILKDTMSAQDKKLSMDNICSVIMQHFSVSKEELTSKSKTNEINEPRQIAMHLIRKLTNRPYKEIGAFFNRDHSTVMNACDKIGQRLEQDENFNELYKRLESTIGR
ncbi:MAG: chromosomal replication initiator protein DnaA [Cardiobacteriaceae bacterium]|nr:chromosomal replication initiator protein DnaA [Cardiobacteriaceae bacterium]